MRRPPYAGNPSDVPVSMRMASEYKHKPHHHSSSPYFPSDVDANDLAMVEYNDRPSTATNVKCRPDLDGSVNSSRRHRSHLEHGYPSDKDFTSGEFTPHQLRV